MRAVLLIWFQQYFSTMRTIRREIVRRGRLKFTSIAEDRRKEKEEEEGKSGYQEEKNNTDDRT